MRLLSNRLLFRVWATSAAPLLLGAVWIAFSTSLWLGIAFLTSLLLWFYDLGPRLALAVRTTELCTAEFRDD